MSFQTLEAVATRHRVVRVNLLPTEIGTARRARGVKIVLGTSLLLVVAACGAGYVVTQGHVNTAEVELAAEQAKTAQLQAAQRPYADVPKVNAALREVQSVQTAVTASDIAWYRYVDAIASGAPADTSFTSVTFAISDPSASAAVGDPLATPGVGTLSVNGLTKSQSQVASWMESLAAVEGLADPRLSNSTDDPQSGLVTFTTTATVTADALLNKQ